MRTRKSFILIYILDCLLLLQWGRVVEDAEVAFACDVEAMDSTASMGPRR